MAKKKETSKPVHNVEVPITKKEKGPGFFPRLLILFSLISIILGVNNFLGWFSVPEQVTDAVLLIAGIWMLKVSFEKGFYKRRKEILKKYI